MTTATTNTVVDHTSDAGFRTWVAEVITMIFTTLGLTQTADTGQINTSTVTRPGGTNSTAGYVIGRFNDSAQGTTPIFFKLEFGTANSANQPQMYITVGSGSDGAGGITGLSMQRVSIGGAGITSTVTAYVSRGCYSAAAGFFGFVWKIGATGQTNQAVSGFAIYRSADNTGAITTDAVMLLTNAQNAFNNTSQGYVQAISNLTGAAYGAAAPWPSGSWGIYPFALTSSLYAGNTQVGPVFQYTPIIGITPWLGIVLNGELAVGATASITLVGSTAHTYISVGSGVCGDLSNLGPQSLSCTGGGANTFSIIMLWE